MKVFIYCIKCPITNEIKYIGQTRQGKKRFHQHITESKKNNRYPLYRWMKKLEEKPIFEIIEECDLDNLNEREEFWIKEIGIDNLYNICETAGKIDITENHNSKLLKGKRLSDYYGKDIAIKIRKKISNSLKGEKNPNYNGATVTDEWREKQSKAQSKVPIDILDLDMNVIASFRNSKDAGKFLNVTSKTIRMAKSHKYKVRKLYYVVNSI